MTLTDFLLARIAEDEAVALDAAGWDLSGGERANGRWSRVGISSLEDDQRRSVIYSDNNQLSSVVADHIARHDPARVLADCERDRQIVELHAVDCYVGTGPDGDDEYFCSGCHAPGGPHPDDVRCPTLCALALPYADHPDYRSEWKP